jgi:hypothetical protein
MDGTQQDANLELLMPAIDLALRHRMVRDPSDKSIEQPTDQNLGDNSPRMLARCLNHGHNEKK